MKPLQIIANTLLILAFALCVWGMADFMHKKEEPKPIEERIYYLEQKNDSLSAEISLLHAKIDSSNKLVAVQKTVIENLKTRRNEKIKNIDTMSVMDLYNFFSAN